MYNFLSSFNLSPKAMIVFLSTLPVTELRASIPIGILILGQGVKVTFFLSIIGNILPVAPIYFLLEPVSRFFSRTPRMQRFFEWLFARAKKRAGLIERYEAIGLMLFVGIPFPGTGVWTGCLIASLLRMRFLPTFLAASAGVIIAAVIVTTLTLLGKANL
ncbi:MAG: small multi-drug export protein [Candidatus Omnitrophica bacterium]|nr:small multi-drug export protein [Candidatus Omnitrophota bacterium]MBU4149414.1 small multi-drug export protein [Candidatus Omnitrophota bacterium]